MPKKFRIILIAVIVITLIIALFPSTVHLKDGGSVTYTSLVYEVVRYHRLSEKIGDDDEVHQYYIDGRRVKIFGLIIYDDEERVNDERLKNQKSMEDYMQKFMDEYIQSHE